MGLNQDSFYEMAEKPEEQAVEHKLNVDDSPSHSGLAAHEGQQKTSEQLKEERRFRRKIDFTILPLLSVVYFLASLDRGDVGNAAVAGMDKDLRLTAQKLANCVSLFYVGYILFMLPGAIFMRKITPHRQLAFALMGWGSFTALISVAKSYGTVVGLRVLVGVAEAFVQSGPLYLSLWYKRDELALRGALFFSAAAVAGSFNGIIAYGIQRNLDGARGIAAWQWIFLIEGVISVAYGFVILVLLPPVPEKVRRGFSEKEKEIAKRRTIEAYNVPGTGIHPEHLLSLAKDPKVYFYIVIYCCLSVSLAAFASFLPLIIKSFGYSRIHTQVLTIPVFACAGVMLLLLGYLSDRLKKRGIVLVFAFSMAGLGWLLLIVSKSMHLSYGATFLIGMGTYPTIVVTQAWMNSNIIGYTNRAGVLAAINIFGQCFSIIGSEVFSDPPRYYRGKGFSLGAMMIGIITATGFQFYLYRKNAEKRRNQDTEEAQRMRVLGVEEVGDKHPDFLYYY